MKTTMKCPLCEQDVRVVVVSGDTVLDWHHVPFYGYLGDRSALCPQSRRFVDAREPQEGSTHGGHN